MSWKTKKREREILPQNNKGSGREGGPIVKHLPLKHEAQSSNPQILHKSWAGTAAACNPSTHEADGTLGLAN